MTKLTVICALILATAGCGTLDADFGHIRWNPKQENSYESEMEQGQSELAREAIHNAELKRVLPATGYAK